jgi:hypothetical protein
LYCVYILLTSFNNAHNIFLCMLSDFNNLVISCTGRDLENDFDFFSSLLFDINKNCNSHVLDEEKLC